MFKKNTLGISFFAIMVYDNNMKAFMNRQILHDENRKSVIGIKETR